MIFFLDNTHTRCSVHLPRLTQQLLRLATLKRDGQEKLGLSESGKQETTITGV